MAQKVTDTVCLVFKQQFTTTVEKQTSKQAYNVPMYKSARKAPFLLSRGAIGRYPLLRLYFTAMILKTNVFQG